MEEISQVKFSKIIEDQRLDAEFYRPLFLEIIEKLKNLPNKRLRELLIDIKSSAFYGAISFYYQEMGELPFIRVSDMNRVFLNTKTMTFLPRRIVEREKSLSTVSNDYLLISKGGTTGKVSLIPSELEEISISRDVIAIKINEKIITNYTLLVFLSTKYGKLQLLRERSRQTIPHLTLNALRKIIIPDIEKGVQIDIDRKLKKAQKLKELAEEKYNYSIELLNKLLGFTIKIKKLENENIFQMNFNIINKNLRFDASYFHPKFFNLIKSLKNSKYEINRIENLVEVSNKKRNLKKPPYTKKEYKYAPISQLNESGQIYDWDNVISWDAPSRAQMIIRKSDIIVPSLKGTFKKISIVPEILDNQLTSTGCFVVRSNNYYPEFLFLLLRSIFFKLQLEQNITGAIMSAIPKTIFPKLLIPKIPMQDQIEIANLIKDYFNHLEDSRILIKEAIKMVERIIENGI